MNENKNKMMNCISPIFQIATQTLNRGYESKMSIDTIWTLQCEIWTHSKQKMIDRIAGSGVDHRGYVFFFKFTADKFQFSTDRRLNSNSFFFIAMVFC